MQKPRKPKITYWQKGKPQDCIFVLDDQNRSPTYIYDFGTTLGLEVMYDYDVPENTYKDSREPKQLSRAEFYRQLKALQVKYNAKFSIKTEWGTNVSQSSNPECKS